MFLVKVGNVKGFPHGRVWSVDLPAWCIQLVYDNRCTIAASKGNNSIVASVLTILSKL